jgi:hypothetical protein
MEWFAPFADAIVLWGGGAVFNTGCEARQLGADDLDGFLCCQSVQSRYQFAVSYASVQRRFPRYIIAAKVGELSVMNVMFRGLFFTTA